MQSEISPEARTPDHAELFKLGRGDASDIPTTSRPGAAGREETEFYRQLDGGLGESGSSLLEG